MTDAFTSDYITHEVKVLEAEIYGCENSLKFIADDKANDKYLDYLGKQFSPANTAYQIALGKFTKSVHSDLLLNNMREAYNKLTPIQEELNRLDAERKADYKTYISLKSRIAKAKERRQFLLTEQDNLPINIDSY